MRPQIVTAKCQGDQIVHFQVSVMFHRCQVTTPTNGITETYTGCTKDFKTRCLAHIRSFENINNKQTTLSTYIWSLKNSNTPYTTQWSHRDRGKPFNSSSGVCRLCLLEKYYILFEQDGASLNMRDEFFNHCYHKAPQLLVNVKTWLVNLLYVWLIIYVYVAGSQPCTFCACSNQN